MKKFIFSTVALSLLFSACTEHYEQDQVVVLTEYQDLTASFDEQSRTYVEDGKDLRWHADDRLTVFYGNTLNNQYKFNGDTGDNSGTFSVVPSSDLGTGNALNSIYALYPYDTSATILESGEITYHLPAVQSYDKDSFGRNANSMVAVTNGSTDNFLAFRNLCGCLKIKLYGDIAVSRIELQGNNGEKIAGAATILAAYDDVPTLTMADNSTESITLDCGAGVALDNSKDNATTFWLVVPPTTFSKGITVYVTDSAGNVYGKRTEKSITIERNAIQPMAAIKVITAQISEVETIPNNEIWYTSVDGQVVMPNFTHIFGATFLSNSYTSAIVRNQDGSTKGIIRFDGDIIEVGDGAFSSCQRLTTLTLPASVTEIGNEAFNGCSALTALYCSTQTPPTLGEKVFEQCGDGFSIYVPEQTTEEYKNSWSSYSSIINSTGNTESWTTPDDPAVIYYKTNDGYALDPYETEGYGANLISNDFNAATGEGAMRFDDKVTTLPENAFAVCTNLSHMRVPSAVTTIGIKAFNGCYFLEELIIPSSVKKIGSSAFAGCTGRVIMHCNVPAVFSNSAFSELVVDEGATVIGDRAFENNTSLKSVKIGKGVLTIGWNAFKQCTSLSKVEIGSWVKQILGAAFYNCTSLKSIYIPGSIVLIESSAFDRCTSLERVDIDDINPWWNIKFVNQSSNPLYCAKNLYLKGKLVTEVFIPATSTTVPQYILAGAACIEKITVMDGVTSFGYQAFAGCTNLKEIVLPDSITKFDGYLFAETGLISFTVPKGVKELSYSLFNGCENLVSVNIHDNVTTIGSGCFRNCTSLKSIKIPNKVLKIDDYAFADCTALEEVTMGSRVAEICSHAFYKCSALKSIVIPRGVSKIDSRTFNGCTALTTVTVQGNLTTIGLGAFRDCTSLESVNLLGTVANINNEAFYKCHALAQMTLNKGLQTIGNDAFYHCYALKEAALYSGLQSIGTRAFYMCKSLKSLDIPEGITNLDYLQYCSGLESIKLPSTITHIPSEAFIGCTSLKEVDFTHIKTMGTYCTFDGCQSIEKIIVPDTVTEIGHRMFALCSSLKSIEFPQGITKFNAYAMTGCKSLENLIIPESVTTIDKEAFSSMESITTVTIPASVTSIGDSAFLKCKNLTSVYCERVTPPALLGKWVFMRDKQGNAYYPMNGKIYVPSGSEGAYQKATNWSVYSNIITGYNIE